MESKQMESKQMESKQMESKQMETIVEYTTTRGTIRLEGNNITAIIDDIEYSNTLSEETIYMRPVFINTEYLVEYVKNLLEEEQMFIGSDEGEGYDITWVFGKMVVWIELFNHRELRLQKEIKNLTKRNQELKSIIKEYEEEDD